MSSLRRPQEFSNHEKVEKWERSVVKEFLATGCPTTPYFRYGTFRGRVAPRLVVVLEAVM